MMLDIFRKSFDCVSFKLAFPFGI